MDGEESFRAFVVARGPRLSRIAFLLTGDHQLAEDLVQTALARAALRWSRLVVGGDPEAYVRRIMVNERTSWWRRQRFEVQGRAPIELDGAAGRDEATEVTDRVALLAALARLTPRQRAVVVLRRAHRIRRRRRLAGAAAAAAATAVVLAAGVAVWPGGRPGAEPAAPVPTVLTSRRPTLPALPDAAVGAASLLYHEPCTGGSCDADVTVLVDGRRYALGRLGDLGTPSLSPDGRWVAALFGSGYRLRDLTSDAAPQAPLGDRLRSGVWEPMGWSPDSRWLVMWSVLGGDTFGYTRVELTSRQVVTYRPPVANEVIAVLPSGELVVVDRGRPLTLHILDPATGAERTVAVDARQAALGPGQELFNGGTDPALVSADGTRITMTVKQDHRAVRLLEISLATGAVERQFALPPGSAWRPAAVAGDAVLMVAHEPTRVGRLDRATGAITVTSPVPDTARVLLPGAHTLF
ncbi:hypothetical protein GCM10020218_029510 [Dactylosporangium vinaceum]